MNRLKKIKMAPYEKEIVFRNNTEKKKWEKLTKKKESDMYYKAIMDYAKRWAVLMQERLIKENVSIFEIAEETSERAKKGSITSIMQSYAVGLLYQSWVYGKNLNKWCLSYG